MTACYFAIERIRTSTVFTSRKKKTTAP